MLLTVSLVGLSCLPASGCYYVTQKVREEKLTTLDQDGDGAPYDGPIGKRDCDDNNPNRSPLMEEVPYDGIDNDCAGDGDLVDIDGDGYPGILQADWTPEKGVEWPAGVSPDVLDCVDVLDPEADADKIAAGWDPARIFPEPNNNNEVDYDGIDADCQRDNDFDADGDGYQLDEMQADFEAYVALWGYEDEVAGWFPGGTPLYGDCDDADGDAYPGDQEDELYDGLDANCDGANDFDGDGDGWMPPQLPDGSDTQPAFQAYVQRYGLQQLQQQLPADIVVGPNGEITLTAFDDCLDERDPLLQKDGSPVDPATVYPRERTVPAGGNGDEPYDGIDTDCNRDNDFDRDRDGFLVSDAVMPDVLVAYAAYIEQWGYAGEVGLWGAENDDIVLVQPPRPEVDPNARWRDCADDDANTYPAALERIGDGQDQDCDGDSNASAFAYSVNAGDDPIPLLAPSAPEVTRIDDLYAIIFVAEQYDAGGANLEDNVGLALPFEVESARSQALPSSPPYRWRLPNENLPLTNDVDVAVHPDCLDPVAGGEAAHIASSYQVGSSNASYLGWYRLVASVNGTLVHNFSTVSTSTNDAVPVDISITLDDDCQPFVIGCSRNPTPSLHITHGSVPLPDLQSAEFTTLPGDVCYPLASPVGTEMSLSVCDGANGCTDVDVDINPQHKPYLVDTVFNAGEDWDSAGLHTSRNGEDLLTRIPAGANGVFLDGDLLPTQLQLLTTERVLSADAQLWNGELYMAVVVDDLKNPIRLIHGDPSAPQETNLTFEPPAGSELVVPTGIGIHVDDDRIAVAVTAEHPDSAFDDPRDVLGWLFLGLPL
jgi:hypothetical protein